MATSVAPDSSKGGWASERSEKELKWLASVNSNTCGRKAGEIFWRSISPAVLNFGFVSGTIY